MTSTSGTVACVPAGTPGATSPTVTKSTSTKTNPDGSTSTTTVTNTCNGEGACSSKTTVTNTGVGGATGSGATAGQAGTPGTTTEQQDKQGEDFCAKNSSLQICKNNIATEATVKEIKDGLNPTTQPDQSSIDSAKTDYETKATEHKAEFEKIGAKGQNNEGVLSWAWIPDNPGGACTGFSGTVAGRSVTLDWCDKLAMIREIASYAMYLLTAFALFRIFANSNGATS